MSGPEMIVGGRYNWRGQPERLIYMGFNWSGNGYWHQFELVDKPGEVWCEVQPSDLECFVATDKTKPVDFTGHLLSVDRPPVQTSKGKRIAQWKTERAKR